MFLLLIETSGNQQYIFSTNKLKENIGASELTYQAGSEWVVKAVAEVTGNRELVNRKRSLRERLLDSRANPLIENDSTKVEVIIATSGKALLITKDEENAQKIIKTVSRRALKDAAGLDITGVYKKFDWEGDVLGEQNSKIHKLYEKARSQNLSHALRFQRIPVITDCETSGLPATKVAYKRGNEIIFSAVSSAKNEAASTGIRRLLNLPEEHRLVGNLDELERRFASELDWLAVIHADGNGLGEIFLKFDQHINAHSPTDNRHYVEQLRKFSIALDICTENAFNTALDEFELDRNKTPLVPLIVGGDDLTVVCNGKYALPFTHRFLTEFEKETQKEQELVGNVLATVAQEALGVTRLSACAGIAIVKPNFPFSVAYDLAEALMKVAKTVKTKVTQANSTDHPSKPYPCSALDFHVVYDSSDVDLKRIREKLEIEVNQVKSVLYHRPFVTTQIENLETTTGKNWAEFHHWQKLEEKVRILQKQNDEGRRLLPNSQIHALRTGLFQGKQKSDAQYQLIRPRYLGQNGRRGIEVLEGESESLFFLDEFANTKQTYVTALVDVIDASGFINVNPNGS